jgi:3-hydroxymyristoyl/3-hydroxydecanoyl-(acyl carrier protein) dehydratase
MIPLFDENDPRLPQVRKKQRQGDSLSLLLWLDPALPWFAGHFPGAPLLPGVVQVHLAIYFAVHELGLDGEFAGMEMVKFQRPIRPGGEVWLQLEWQAEARRLVFSYLQDGEVAGSGRVKL